MRFGWALPIYSATITIGCLIAATVGVATGRLPLTLFGLGLAAFFGWLVWILAPPNVERLARVHGERDRDILNRFFSFLHITWAVDPEWRERHERKP